MRRLHLSGFFLAIFLQLLPSVALAHKASDSYLNLNIDGKTLTGRWDIALRDLEYAIGIDADQDGAITWGELRARHMAITDYALSRLSVKSGENVCQLKQSRQLVDNHSDGAYTVLRFGAACPSTTDDLSLDYRLFFDLDRLHRGLLRVVYPNSVQTAVLSPKRSRIELNPYKGRFQQFIDYWREGVWHIWIGFDHILFLIALLLPAVLYREGKRWRQVDSFRIALMNVVGIVTAFTLAHSVTLAIAALGWVALPARWVESAIAATVVMVALNNLYPLIEGRQWLIAFCLGLIHGFGFASVLADLGLPNDTLALALLGFNLGVETGQLGIVAAFLPIAYGLRRTWVYRRAALGLGSAAVGVIGLAWLLERSLDLRPLW